jgi:type I restriction enzyme S subunit
MNAVELGALFLFIRNGMNVRQDKSGRGLAITRIETISDATVDGSRVGYADLQESDCHEWLLQPGDILFSHINSVEHIGKCAVYRGSPAKLVHGMNLLCMRCDQKRLLPEFAKYLIRSSAFRADLSRFIKKAVNQASVSIGDLRTVRVVVPPVAQQRRIAEVLDRADTLRAKRRAAFAHLDTLIRSIFLDLFGSETETDTANGRVRLESITSLITKGTTPTSIGLHFADRGVPFVRVQNLMSGVVNWEEDVLFISPETHRALSRSQIRAGDLLVSIAGTIGRVAIVTPGAPELNCNQAVAIVRPTADAIPEYLVHWLQGKSAQRQMLGAQVTGTISNLSLTQLRDIKLSVPPVSLQLEFARRAAAIEKTKAGHRASLAELDALFGSLQQRAFQGEL